ncbi:flagellar motor protein MotS [Cytobacillus purgationiresistens]|uniref:Chemotaxis protein MotB n=1 Tax=Cytobacillus purgationiresistens TaxID=863449 RepID=A0ABU0ALJ8_9BACI|nr:flagellar motor protein MotS [Cytobacillus purgationiresistens]MDQ0272143.1 chemotaxis protein MotB [Cytobacillus purgationiresistens]
MRRRKRPSNDKKGAPIWMVTYSDLVTLILVFFILLFSMSQIDMIKFKALSESFSDNPIFDSNPSIIPLDEPTDAEKKNENESNDNQKHSLESLLSEVQGFLEANGMEDVIVANKTERGVVLVLQEQVLFDTGEANLIEGSFSFLDKLGEMLAGMANLIKVEGHTDNRPISTVRYPSNWELSAARSSSVIRYLIENHEIDSIRFTAIGFGDTRPIVPNDHPSNWEKNRRVEIIISDPEYIEETNEAKESD